MDGRVAILTSLELVLLAGIAHSHIFSPLVDHHYFLLHLPFLVQNISHSFPSLSLLVLLHLSPILLFFASIKYLS